MYAYEIGPGHSYVNKALATRLIRSHEEWIPHGYMVRAVEHLIKNRSAALFLDPGLGKTSIVLAAFLWLQQNGMANRMLVVAPLRVCQLVWKQEGQKWTQFRDLTFSLLHGSKKEERLNDQVDIHLINPEGIAWLSQQYYGRSLPWDVLTVDELAKFKNARSQRSKRLRARLSQVNYRWGLTGSPAPNGYMDLFGQMLILDGGAALGRFITYFRDQFFVRGFDGFSYDLKPDGAARIEQKIAPYVLRMSADDYLKMPPLQDNIIYVELTKEQRKIYDEMKKEMIVSLPEGVVTAANSAAVYTKLAQLANGAVYISSNQYAEVHSAKLDALEDLVEELAGQQLLVAYEFQHDLARLQERFPNAATLTGQSHKKIVEIEAAWNAGEIQILLAHPQSAGHGLNLQGSGASHICWFSKPWDLDLYDQFIRRLLRQGTTAKHIINHSLVVKNSIDEIKSESLDDKDVTQQRLLDALNAEIISDNTASFFKGDSDMALRKLGFQGEQGGAGAAAPAAGEAKIPKGWGKPATDPAADENNSEDLPPADERPQPKGWGQPGAVADPQRSAIQDKIRAPEPDGDEDAPPPANRALEAFGSGIVQGLTAPEGEARAETTAAGESATGRPLPPGWGQPSTETGTADAQTGAAEPAKPENTAKPRAARGRSADRTDAAPLARVENAAITGAGNAVGMVESAFVRIELNGLPREAIAAALAAIAKTMATSPARD